MKNFLISIRTTLVTLALTGLCYPLLTTGVALLVFPRQAQGSLVANARGTTAGSELISQPFAGAAYLNPRPSAAGEKGFDATASGGSNLGPTSKALHDRVSKDLEQLIEDNPQAAGDVPVELVSTSASGLDPHLSPKAALWQVPRIAHARGIAEERVRTVIEAQIEGRDLAVLGEPRVNVLLTNLALDRIFGQPPAVAGR
jgi:potassium-transporting ATPase KdpC subunit